MYCLSQAGIIAQELLEKRLAEYGCHQSKVINRFRKHKTRSICFCLVVINQEDEDHLINAIKKYCPMMVNKEAAKYIGLIIECDYQIEKRTSICRATFRKHS
jgi:hypothetical protein